MEIPVSLDPAAISLSDHSPGLVWSWAVWSSITEDKGFIGRVCIKNVIIIITPITITISTWIETPFCSANHYLQISSFWFETKLRFCIKVMNDSENCLLFAAPSFPSIYHTLQENNAFTIQCSERQTQNTQYKDKVKILKLVVFIINFCSQLLCEDSSQENQWKSCSCLWSSYYNNAFMILIENS